MKWRKVSDGFPKRKRVCVFWRYNRNVWYGTARLRKGRVEIADDEGDFYTLRLNPAAEKTLMWLDWEAE